ncbi:hypothetical protein E4T56_gene6017 [Termitomyces sp. T112]|nr:hypothetical protein E4T56_gene6017 [Termitomyces sp. T112]
MVDLVLHYQDHSEQATFAITSLGKQDMILGFTWLCEHNPEIDWAKGEVKMSPCLHRCITCTEEACKEQRAKVCEHAASSPLAFPHREALYEDVQAVGCESPEEEEGEGKWTCILDAESPDETIEGSPRKLPPPPLQLWTPGYKRRTSRPPNGVAGNRKLIVEGESATVPEN